MEKKELSMEMRLLLAFVLMGLVLFVSPYLYKTPPQPPPSQPLAKTTEPVKAAEPEKPAPLAPPVLQMPGQVQADKEESITVETDLYRVEFSNRGAVARSWILKDYRDRQGKPLELVNQKALAKVPAPFALVFKTGAPATDLNMALFKAERSPDKLRVDFEFSDGRALTKKSFQFASKSYLVQVTSEVAQNGALVPHALAWRGGFGDSTVTNPVPDQKALYYDLAAAKLIEKDVKDAKNGPISSSGQYSFAGLEDKFFAGVVLPGARSPFELTEYSDAVPNAAGADEQRIGASVGGEGLNTFSLFVGPKDIDLLRKVDPKLEQLVDWGWFEVIAKPLFLALNWTSDHVVHNYGWAIIMVTIAINTVLFPLRISSMKSSKKMQALQPQIAAINAKYKNLSLRDPKKTEQNQEMMDLYKRHGVNPVGGCLPMALQMPFFFAFYKVLSVAIEMRGANWLWVGDLSQPETLAIRALPVLLIVTQFLQQKMTPSPGMDPAQQKMMMIMPLALGYMFYFASSGLVLYWLTSNVVGIAQQVILNRSTATPAVVDVKPTPKKKSRD